MNWGKRIILGMGLFMGFILTLVIIMMRQKIDLVEEDYYKKELNYDQQISAQQTYASAPEKISMEIEKDSLLLYFPSTFQSEDVTIALQCPNDKNQDLVLKAKPVNRLVIQTEKFRKGLFICTVSGRIEGIPYEMSQQVTIR
jgi:hypothetical protein